MKKPKAKSQWFPMGLEVEENLEHGYPYIVVHYQKAGTTEIKRGRAMYVCGSGPEGDKYQLFPEQLNVGAFKALAALYKETLFKASNLDPEHP